MQAEADKVEVIIGGAAHAGWDSYEIDSDLMTPADAWKVSLHDSQISLPGAVKEGASVVVKVGSETVLQGRLDERVHSISKGGHDLSLSGRDNAAILLDCSAPIFSAAQLSLADVVAKCVRPLGITQIKIDADTQLTREKVNTEPGDSAWDSLRRAAEANGLWPWFEPDGTLVVGGPKYDTEPVATLSVKRDGNSNVLSLAERRSVAERYSEVTVLGQSHAVGNRDGRRNVKAVVKDTGVDGYRPRIVTDHEAVSESIASARGQKIISDARIKGYELAVEVKGHRTEAGVLWKPGQRVRVLSELNGIDGIYFLMARRFTGGRATGQKTRLSLREDGVWTLYAHPSKRRHRRGKNSLPGQVIDLTKGAQ